MCLAICPQRSYKSNPADEGSKGVSADCLERWINGPSFLTQSDEMWPKQPEDLCSLAEDQSELKKTIVYTATTTINPTNFELTDVFIRFSSWIRLKRTILRYKTNGSFDTRVIYGNPSRTTRLTTNAYSQRVKSTP